MKKTTRKTRTAAKARSSRARGSAHLIAAEHMDWQQVVENGGPPCFRIEEYGNFCGRAERWHAAYTHRFVSLADMLRSFAQNAEIAHAGDGQPSK